MEEHDQIQSIDEQIAELSRKKASLLEKTRNTDLETCKQLIRKHGFSKSELGFIGKAGTNKGKSASASGKPVKYANPAEPASKGWNGHGRKPGWLVDALEKGAKLEDFLV